MTSNRTQSGEPPALAQRLVVVAACLLTLGACYLAITRADALILDVGSLVGCL